MSITWKAVGADEFDDLVALAERCLAADGGLPLAAEPAFLRRRWTEPGTITTSARDPQGRLIAAAAVRDETIYTGMIDPAARGTGLGAELLDWGLLRATTVETEGLTPGAEALFASRGLHRVFAEHVMRIDLGPAPAAPTWPAGTTLESWDHANVGRFHAVYEVSFRERPGFRLDAGPWIGFVADDDEFRPQWSVLATLPGAGDAGFVTAGVGWIVQVGVVPAARGRGLGAALLLESLSRMRAAGEAEAWLDVNVDNRARHLYERLGFVDRGRRARYRTEPADPAP